MLKLTARNDKPTGQKPSALKPLERPHAAENAWDVEQRAVEALPPGGEPIKIGHHSERRHRNAIARAHDATRRAIEATDEAAAAAAKADAAAAGTARRYSPVTVKNRIEKLEAEQRRDQRILNGYRRVVARTATHEYVDEFDPATGPYREQVIARMAQRVDQITYWTNIYAEQQAAGVASRHSREHHRQRRLHQDPRDWYPVVRANPKPSPSRCTRAPRGRTPSATTKSPATAQPTLPTTTPAPAPNGATAGPASLLTPGAAGPLSSSVWPAARPARPHERPPTAAEIRSPSPCLPSAGVAGLIGRGPDRATHARRGDRRAE